MKIFNYMVNPSYKDKLLDPRWQKIRLKILKRDRFKCCTCGDDKSTLHIHHLKYAKSGNPWDSNINDLITLCKHCHSLEEFLKVETSYLLNCYKERIDGNTYRCTCLIGKKMEYSFIGIFNVSNNGSVNGSTISLDAAKSIHDYYKNVLKSPKKTKNKPCQE